MTAKLRPEAGVVKALMDGCHHCSSDQMREKLGKRTTGQVAVFAVAIAIEVILFCAFFSSFEGTVQKKHQSFNFRRS